MREAVRLSGAGALLAGPTVLAFFSGGFFDRPRLIAGIAAWALVAVAALTAARPLPASSSGRAALAGLVLLTAWTAVSLAWAPLGGRAQDDLQRLVLYLGFFVAAIALLRGATVRRWLEPSLVLGAFLVVAYGLSERLLPGLIELERSLAASGRLEQPITYWNAFGAVAAVGLVLAIRVAGEASRGRALRAAAASAGVLLAVGVYLSFSRGALAAVAAGVLVLVALAPAGRPQLRSAIAVLCAGAVAAFVASNLSTIESLDRGAQGDSSDGVAMLVTLVVLSLVAAWWTVRVPRRHRLHLPLPVSRRTAVLTLGAVALLVAVTAAVMLEGKPQGVSPATQAGAARLGSIDTNRYRYWEVALEAWRDEPLVGIGSGGFAVEWRKVRDRVDHSGDAHSLYVETAAELGVAGLATLILFLGGVGAATVRLYRFDAAAGTGIAAGLAAWIVHAGLDWDWEMPALTLMALVLGAAAIALGEEASAPAPDERRESPTRSARNLRVRTLSLLFTLALIAAVAVPTTALAQSAGDEQYVDPFQQDQGNQGGGGGGGDTGSQDGSSGGDQGGSTTTTPPSTGDGTAGVSESGTTDTTSGGNGDALPSTGLALGGPALTGVLLLAGGIALRRRA